MESVLTSKAAQGGWSKNALVSPNITDSVVLGIRVRRFWRTPGGSAQGGWSENALVSPNITESVVPWISDRRYWRTPGNT